MADSLRGKLLADPAAQQKLRASFRQLNRVMVILWRVGMGPLFGMFPRSAGQILVLRHVGRRSGNVFLTPVNFAEHDSSIFCIAAFGSRTDWYRNLRVAPETEAWLPAGRWTVLVSDADSRGDRLERIRDVLIGSGFAAPAFGLSPNSLTDEELDAVTSDYRLIELTRVGPLPGSPADLRWIWLVGGAVVLACRSLSRWIHARSDGNSSRLRIS